MRYNAVIIIALYHLANKTSGKINDG